MPISWEIELSKKSKQKLTEIIAKMVLDYHKKRKQELVEKIGKLKERQFLEANIRNEDYDKGFNQAVSEIFNLLKNN